MVKLVDAFGSGSNNYGSIITGLITASLLYFFKAIFMPAPSCSGTYYTKSTVIESTWNPYKGMNAFHTIIISCNGNEITGSSEMTGEICKKHKLEYQGAGKRRGEVTGCIERRAFRRSIMRLHIVEQGAHRKFTISLDVKLGLFGRASGLLSGQFYSSAANSKGTVLCGRKEFKEHPTGYSQFPSSSEST